MIVIFIFLVFYVLSYLLQCKFSHEKKQKLYSAELFHNNIKKTSIQYSSTNPQHATSAENDDKYNYAKAYASFNLFGCSMKYDVAIENQQLESYNYSAPADASLLDERMSRAVLFYFPVNSIDHFKPEFKWVYRSWIEMQQYEPAKWRTDLILFIDNTKPDKHNLTFLYNLNCSFENKRQRREDRPMCILIAYISIADRNLSINQDQNKMISLDDENIYDHIYTKINIFSDDYETNLKPFYLKLKRDLKHYGYLDSILMAFEGYDLLKDSYDFLLRSDMDVFLTPLFSKWLPRKCYDFVTGGGSFSTQFNVKRLRRIAKHLNLQYASEWNLGSTWYSSPAQFRLVSYLTLASMLYVSNEEFSQPEREGKIGTMNWPVGIYNSFI